MSSPALSEAIVAFDSTLVVKSPETRKTYRSALRRFEEFLRDTGRDPIATQCTELSADTLDNFYLWLTKTYGRQARSTVLSYLAPTRAFFRFLDRNRYLAPGLSYEQLRDRLRELVGRLHYRTPRVDDAVALLVVTASEAPLPPDDRQCRQARLCLLRDRALISTLYSAACRRSEASRLNRQDIQDGYSDRALITGKGEKERVVFFDQDALDSIRAYLSARADGYTPLFLRHDDGRGKPGLRGENWRLSPHGVWKVVKDYSAQCGVPATTHHLRHLKARVLLNGGAQLAEVQDILGHASPETTKRIYAPYTTQHLREAFEKFSVPASEMARRLRQRK